MQLFAGVLWCLCLSGCGMNGREGWGWETVYLVCVLGVEGSGGHGAGCACVCGRVKAHRAQACTAERGPVVHRPAEHMGESGRPGQTYQPVGGGIGELGGHPRGLWEGQTTAGRRGYPWEPRASGPPTERCL